MDQKIIDRLMKWAGGGIANPLWVEIWPTRRCNLSCKFCRPEGTEMEYEKELNFSKLSQIIKECASLGVKRILFAGGGEPLMRKNELLLLMKEVKELGMEGFLITNGTLLNKDDVIKIVKIMWDELVFSLDAPDAKTNDYLRGVKGSYDRVIKAMRIFKQQKKEKGSEFPRIAINMVLTNKNFIKLKEMVKLAPEMGCDSLLLQSLMVIFPEARKLKMNSEQIEEFEKIIEDANDLRDEYGICSNMNEFVESKYIEKANEVHELLTSDLKHEKDFTSIPCYEPWYRMTITPEGKTGPCAIIAERSQINIRSNSLKEIWFSDFFAKIREKMISRNISDTCKTCCIGKVFENREIRENLRRFH